MAPTVSDHELIRNTIARYCLGIDLRDWNQFAKAFTKDVQFHFPNPIGTIEGIPSIVSKIQAMLGSLQTQHALSTQLIELTNENTAEATTYGRAIHFGTGEHEGKEVTAWGVYKDKLVKDDTEGGRWKIYNREILFVGPMKGDASLLAM